MERKNKGYILIFLSILLLLLMIMYAVLEQQNRDRTAQQKIVLSKNLGKVVHALLLTKQELLKQQNSHQNKQQANLAVAEIEMIHKASQYLLDGIAVNLSDDLTKKLVHLADQLILLNNFLLKGGDFQQKITLIDNTNKYILNIINELSVEKHKMFNLYAYVALIIGKEKLVNEMALVHKAISVGEIDHALIDGIISAQYGRAIYFKAFVDMVDAPEKYDENIITRLSQYDRRIAILSKQSLQLKLLQLEQLFKAAHRMEISYLSDRVQLFVQHKQKQRKLYFYLVLICSLLLVSIALVSIFNAKSFAALKMLNIKKYFLGKTDRLGCQQDSSC